MTSLDDIEEIGIMTFDLRGQGGHLYFTLDLSYFKNLIERSINYKLLWQMVGLVNYFPGPIIAHDSEIDKTPRRSVSKRGSMFLAFVLGINNITDDLRGF